MNDFSHLLDAFVEVEISGKVFSRGILIDVGPDIVVLYNGQDYLYVPIIHVHQVKKYTPESIEYGKPTDLPIYLEEEAISYRKMLLNAKGRFVEVFVTGDRSIHGYITNVLNDYIVFYSPVYKTMMISMNHLKWLIPYTGEVTPYTLDNNALPVKPSTFPIQRSFEEQLKKQEGKLIVLDLGDHPNKIGLLKKGKNQMIELITATGKSVFWNTMHIKTVHQP